MLSNSKLIKAWKDTDAKITFCYNEAKDNSKFIQSMENSCHSLYLDSPVNMSDSILKLLQTVRLIYSVSKFYNTSERTSSLMVKVSSVTAVIPKTKHTNSFSADNKSNDRNVQVVHNISI